MNNFKKSLMSIAIVGSAAISGVASANTIVDDWYLDLTAAGAGKTTNIGNLVLQGGTGTVEQDYGDDLTLSVGDTFTEFGSAFSVTYTPDTAVGTLDTGVGFLQPTGTEIEFTFTGLTGFISAINVGTGAIDYVFDDFATNALGNINMTVDGTSVFDFGIASPSGGDIGQFHGGLATSGTTDLLLFAKPGSAGSTIWGDTGTDTAFDMFDLLGNVATLFDVHLVNTLNAAGSTFDYVNGEDDTLGTHSATLEITSTGNLNLVNVVPEPTSIALLGLGLLGLGAVSRKKQA